MSGPLAAGAVGLVAGAELQEGVRVTGVEGGIVHAEGRRYEAAVVVGADGANGITAKTLDLGGVRVRIMRLGPGHTRGDTVMFVEEDRVLFSVDLTMKGLFPAFAAPQ